MSEKKYLEEFTESEFLEFVKQFLQNPDDLTGSAHDAYINTLIDRFEELIENPAGSDLIYHPGPSEEDNPEGVVKRVKEWRAQNGKPGFKQV